MSADNQTWSNMRERSEYLRGLIQKAVDVETDECLEWPGFRNEAGYGRFGNKSPHRRAYELAGGTLIKGMQIDHLCRNRACYNPRHLEQVTPRENTLRGDTLPAKNAAKTECINGHPYTADNVVPSKWGRRCRACLKARDARYHRQAMLKRGNVPKKKRGKPLTDNEIANILHLRGALSHREIAKLYDTSKSYVGRLIKGEWRKNVTGHLAELEASLKEGRKE